MVKELGTKAEFDDALKAAGSSLVAIDFTATWCGPCQKIGPVFVTLADEHKDVHFFKVDVDKNSETSEACGVKCMPTFMFYKDGKKVDEFSGADGEKLKQKIVSLK